MFADFNYYHDVFLGNAVPPENFNNAAQYAGTYIDYITLGTATRLNDRGELPECFKMATCALAELAYAASKNCSISASEGPEVKSESVGSYSVTYATANDKADARKALRAEMYEVARQYLWAYMYRGVPTL